MAINRVLQQSEQNVRRMASNDERLRVFHLVSSLNIGGLEKVVHDLVRYSDRERFDIRILCLGELGAMESAFRELNIPLESLGLLGLRTWQAVLGVTRRFRVDPPHVLHTHNPSPHLIGALAARICRVPAVIHTKHGRNYPHIRHRVWQNRFSSWLTDVVVPVSEDAARVVREIEGVPASKVCLIRNGIDLQGFFIGEQPVVGRLRRAIHVARLIYPTKDQRTLLRAVRIVVDSQPDFVLDIVGDGPHREDLETLSDELGLTKNVNFLGFRNDVQGLLTTAEFFVLSSLQEGLSITLLEAMAAGLPVVATAVGGNAEVVVEGATGRLVPPGDPEAMARAMLAMLENRETARRMGLAGRQRVESHFDLRKVVQQYESLYIEIARRKSPMRQR